MDDKTTKIPSLKEFQKAQQEQQRRDKVRRTNAVSSKSRAVRGDTHKVDLSHSKSKSSHTPSAKTREYKSDTRRKTSSSLGSTQKIDSKRVEEQYDRFKAFESDVQYHGRMQSPSNSKPLTRTRAAGQRSPEQRPSSQQPPARSTASRPTEGGRPVGRAPQPVDKAVRRKKKKKPLSPFQRKVRRVLVYVLIVAGILLAGVILSMTVLFKTENIVVNVPDNFYSAEDIISASGLHYQDNIFMAGKARAEERLEEKFPYIKSAEVTAVIPDTINIDITLSTPSFAVKTDKLTYIANEDCKVLEVASTADEVDVPLIEGVEVKSAKAGENLEFESDLVKDILAEIFNFAKEKGYKKITRLDIETQTAQSGTQTLEIRYVYDDRIVVYLGIPENITYKMQTAQTIINEKLDVNNTVLTGELDVSQSYDTKKSYFNQYSLIPQAVITEPATEVTEANEENNEDNYW